MLKLHQLKGIILVYPSHGTSGRPGDVVVFKMPKRYKKSKNTGRFTRMKKAVLISCFDWYKKRLKPIREQLIERGYEVTVLEADLDPIRKMPLEIRYAECTYIHVPLYRSNLSIQRIRSHLVFGKKVGEVLNHLKPEFILCQVPPNNVAKVCRDYKKNNACTRLIIDVIDLWPESMPLGNLKNLIPFWKNWRNDALKVADYVFTECDLYQEKLKGTLKPDKTSTLYLFKNQTEEEKQLVREIIECRKQDDIIRFAYLGSINNIIDIDEICRVIRSFLRSGKTCELHAIGDGENKDRFEEAVKNTGCKAYFYGPVFDELEKIRILTPCDYAFNMMKGSISVGLTIKSIDYLSYGLPLINNIKGDTWKLVEEEGIGINVEKSKEITLQPVNRNGVIDIFSKFSSVRFSANVEKALFSVINS